MTLSPKSLAPRIIIFALVAAWLSLAATSTAFAAKPASSVLAEKLVQPADVAALLKNATTSKPLMLQVGFKTMFDQAHIPGSEYAGPGNTPAGLQVLRDRVAALPKNSAILIYCGCCPWTRCPNIAAAYDTLTELGFTNVKVMYIGDNFGTDWVEKGYPTTKGGTKSL